jgi:type IV pilus assembly protein PilE
MPHHYTRASGFTLIEVMVVVAIVAIISSLAYPAYTSHIVRARRADARAVLMESAQFLERHYSAQGSYDGAALPLRLQTAPAGAGEGASYAISVDAAATGWTLTAQVSAARPDEACGNLVLTHTGQKSRTGEAMSEAACWR